MHRRTAGEIERNAAKPIEDREKADKETWRIHAG